MKNRSHSVSPRSSLNHTEEDYSNLSDSDEFSRSGAQTPVFMPDDIEARPAIFSFDLERSRQADHLLQQLREFTRTTLETSQDSVEKEIQKKMQIRDACVANIEKCRQSAYFQELLSKLQNHEKLLPAEYMIYALITDNVNDLDLATLKEIPNDINNEFNQHINILIAVREWQIAAGINERRQASIKLRAVMNARHFDTYLNLAGVNLSGASLQHIDLSYTNFEKADLSHTQLDDSQLNFCNLDHANLSYINHPSTRGATVGPEIQNSSARQACVDGVILASPRWNNSDFSGSSFKKSNLQSGYFKNTIFDHCDFDGSTIKIAHLPLKTFCSFKGANLANAVLMAMDYKNIDITEAKLIAVNDFETALDIIHDRTLKLYAFRGVDTHALPDKIRHRQNIIAENIVHHLTQLEIGNEHMKEFLDIALEHPMFEPQSIFEQIANEAERVYHAVGSTLFAPQRHHDLYRTKAVEILEAAWDRADAASRVTNVAANNR